MNEIALKNGTSEQAILVSGILLTLRELMAQNVLAFYDLVMMCRNPNYQAFDANIKLLQESGLLESNRKVHDSIRNIVLSAVEGERLEMRLVSPYAVAS
jgi:hypothetical protein